MVSPPGSFCNVWMPKCNANVFFSHSSYLRQLLAFLPFSYYSWSGEIRNIVVLIPAQLRRIRAVTCFETEEAKVYLLSGRRQWEGARLADSSRGGSPSCPAGSSQYLYIPRYLKRAGLCISGACLCLWIYCSLLQCEDSLFESDCLKAVILAQVVILSGFPSQPGFECCSTAAESTSTLCFENTQRGLLKFSENYISEIFQ